MKKIILSILFLAAVIAGCRKEEAPVEVPEFDRGPMLENWVDNIIIPAHQAYNATTVTLLTQTEAFIDVPTIANLEAMRMAWFESYKAWQNVPFFVLKGSSRVLDCNPDLLYFNMNNYPTDIEKLSTVLVDESYDFASIESKFVQGYPALDYMLYGLAGTDDDILSFYTTNDKAEKYKRYLFDLTNAIHILSDDVVNTWIGKYRDEFILEDGLNENSSVRRVINDFSYSFAFDVINNKIGIPSGASHFIIDDKVSVEKIEAPYRGDISKVLLLEALNAAQDFYNGVPFKGSFEERGPSLYHYLDVLDTQKDGKRLCDLINTEFDKSRAEINKLSNDFASDLINQNSTVQDIYTQLGLNSLLIRHTMAVSMRVSIPSGHFCGGGD